MAKEWYHNAKTGEINSYEVCGTLTDLPRGVFIAYRDYLTTGLKSEREAKTWATEWSACYRCRQAVFGKPGEKCKACGFILSAPTKKIGA